MSTPLLVNEDGSRVYVRYEIVPRIFAAMMICAGLTIGLASYAEIEVEPLRLTHWSEINCEILESFVWPYQCVDYCTVRVLYQGEQQSRWIGFPLDEYEFWTRDEANHEVNTTLAQGMSVECYENTKALKITLDYDKYYDLWVWAESAYFMLWWGAASSMVFTILFFRFRYRKYYYTV